MSSKNNSTLLVFYNSAIYDLSVDREPIDKIFHAALKAYCHGKRGAQASIVAKSGVTQPQLSAIQNGKAAGSEETRRAIAEAAGMEYEEFLDIGRERIGVPRKSRRKQSDLTSKPQSDKTTNLLKMAQRILDGGDHSLALALEQNIIAFAESLDKNKRLGDQEQDIEAMQRQLEKATKEGHPVPGSSPEKTGT